MAVRSSMLALIGRIRLMINDPMSDVQVYSNQDIQDALDTHRVDQRYLSLQAVESIAQGGVVSYEDFYAPVGDWESDAVLADASYAVLAPDSSDWQVGHWTFASEPDLPVRITGRSYDRYAAAVSLIETWAAKVALDFDFTAGGQSFSRSEKQAQLLEMAQRYRAMMKVSGGKIIRDDAN